MKIFCSVLCCLVLLINGFESRARSCPQINQISGRIENSPCPYIVLSTKAYIYRPSEPLTFWLVSEHGAPLHYYNVEIINMKNKPVGHFTKADNICLGNDLATHQSDMDTFDSRKTEITWLAPEGDSGDLYIKFSAGRKNQDGSVSLWPKCGQLSQIKYYRDIPEDMLRGIENPLGLTFAEPRAPSPPSLPNEPSDYTKQSQIRYQPDLNFTPLRSGGYGKVGNTMYSSTSDDWDPFSSVGSLIEFSERQPNSIFNTPPKTTSKTSFKPANRRQNSVKRVAKQSKKHSTVFASPSRKPTTTTNNNNSTKSKPAIQQKKSSNFLSNIWDNSWTDLFDYGNIATDGKTWCRPPGAARYEVVPRTRCRKYRQVPDGAGQVQECPDILIFDVNSCSCAHSAPCAVP